MKGSDLSDDGRAMWSIHGFGWMMVASWFVASLVSQIMYMAVNGEPYGPEILLSLFGSWYWILLILEMVVWISLATLILTRFRRKKHGGVDVLQTPSPSADC